MKLLVTQKPRDYFCCQSVIRTDALTLRQPSIFTASYIGPVITLFGLYLSKSSKYSAVKFEWRCAEKVELAPQFVWLQVQPQVWVWDSLRISSPETTSPVPLHSKSIQSLPCKKADKNWWVSTALLIFYGSLLLCGYFFVSAKIMIG